MTAVNRFVVRKLINHSEFFNDTGTKLGVFQDRDLIYKNNTVFNEETAWKNIFQI